MTYDLIIIGGGPAGIAAGVYAARKRLKTLVIAKEIGGQSTVSGNIQNWIGTVSISGAELGKSLKKHLLAYAHNVLSLKEGEFVKKIEKKKENFSVQTDKAAYDTRAVLITSGSHRRKLNAPGADKFEHKGLTYCASCDGPLFAGMDVVVVGGGNAGFETAAELLAYTKKVTLFEYGETFKADPITIQKVCTNKKMKAVSNVEITEIKGDKFVNGISYKNRATGKETTLPIQGIFVEIGAIPTTEFAKGVVELNKFDQIVTDPRNQKTTIDGIWAAGDCTDVLYHQNNIAVGDAVRALEDIYIWLSKK